MPLARRGTVLIVIAIVSVLPLTGCSTVISGTPQAAGYIPPGLSRYYQQSLHWGSCATGYATDEHSRATFDEPGLRCARLTVPLDYAHPGGRTISIGVLQVLAANPFARIGSLVINPGGPGESGMVAAASIADQIAGTQLADRFDIVGFDPRGVGASRPQIRCLTDAEQDALRLEVPLDDPKQEASREQSENQRYARECGQRTGTAVLENIGTREVAKDLDVLRAALGDAKLTYLGYSYGTKIGTAYAEDFPRNVRAMVLDGAVDPDQGLSSASQAQGDGFAAAFGAFAEWCAKQDPCGLGGDPRHADSALDKLIAPLKTAALAVGARKLSFSDVQTAVDAALYSQDTWPRLNNGLVDLADGNGRILLELADAYLQRGPDGHYSNNQDAFTAIRCVDYPHGSDPEDPCAPWPVPPTGKPHLPKVVGLAPVLVVSTSHDPATPYQSGVNLANDLHGELLTFQGTQHTAFLNGNSCVDVYGDQYLISLTAVLPGTTCHG